jgi:hypothetical protein
VYTRKIEFESRLEIIRSVSIRNDLFRIHLRHSEINFENRNRGLNRFFKIFLWQMPLFLLTTNKQCILSRFIYNSIAMFP